MPISIGQISRTAASRVGQTSRAAASRVGQQLRGVTEAELRTILQEYSSGIQGAISGGQSGGFLGGIFGSRTQTPSARPSMLSRLSQSQTGQAFKSIGSEAGFAAANIAGQVGSQRLAQAKAAIPVLSKARAEAIAQEELGPVVEIVQQFAAECSAGPANLNANANANANAAAEEEYSEENYAGGGRRRSTRRNRRGRKGTRKSH